MHRIYSEVTGKKTFSQSLRNNKASDKSNTSTHNEKNYKTLALITAVMSLIDLIIPDRNENNNSMKERIEKALEQYLHD